VTVVRVLPVSNNETATKRVAILFARQRWRASLITVRVGCSEDILRKNGLDQTF
jgi:hypothetical protein